MAEAQETGGEIWELHDVLSNDSEDPSARAARKMDWESFMASLSAREQAVIVCIIEGRSLRDVARAFRLCDSSIQGTKRSLAKAIVAFMGDDILVVVRRQPRWKDNLEATRERLACREQRRHL